MNNFFRLTIQPETQTRPNEPSDISPFQPVKDVLLNNRILKGNMTCRGTVKGNVVVLEPGVSLPDGTLVHVETEFTSKKSKAGNTDSLFRMSELAADTGITDLATNADHYLYGHPKVNHGG